MNFDINTNFSIFDQFLAKRPEVNPTVLKHDLQTYYLPYLQKLVELKKHKSDTLLVGVSAIQGAGKTTQGEILEILLKSLGFSSISRSIDDHYITHQELCDLRQKDPRFIRRGVTHDINLAINDLKSLQLMSGPILVSGYDKGAHHGDGDRFKWIIPEEGVGIKGKVEDKELMVDKVIQKVKAFVIYEAYFHGVQIRLPENMGSDIPIVEHIFSPGVVKYLNEHLNVEIGVMGLGDGKVRFMDDSQIVTDLKTLPLGWRVVTKKPDFIFYDGWMLGARSVQDESVFNNNLPALETPQDKEFAKFINQKLNDYLPLWQMIHFLNVLYVPDFQVSIKWRDQAEETLRAKGEGMTHEQITEFVHYFWRSVHPAIHIKNLATDISHTNQVVIINNDHSIGEILTPEQVRTKHV